MFTWDLQNLWLRLKYRCIVGLPLEEARRFMRTQGYTLRAIISELGTNAAYEEPYPDVPYYGMVIYVANDTHHTVRGIGGAGF
jgi:radical SAM superfamily enzyme YgiQ (UPF0313 family)